jgi:hypothetical protein
LASATPVARRDTGPTFSSRRKYARTSDVLVGAVVDEVVLAMVVVVVVVVVLVGGRDVAADPVRLSLPPQATSATSRAASTTR